MQELVFTPADFVAAINQALEFAFPSVIIEGELSNFKVSKNRWVYFDLKDEEASVRFFGTVYSLPGPLEDGMSVRVVGVPSLHPKFGFSVNFRSILPVGEGQLKNAADLLFKKLEAEGLFSPERKRHLPQIPQTIGLITAADSAAAADFAKILNERWSGVEVLLHDVYVQGEQAPMQIIRAIEHLNQLSEVPEALVITRGGGSAEDLAAFNDERLVRAVAVSRIPTLVAIGHEVDVSLAELAADQRASTPSNAAQMLVPDKKHELVALAKIKGDLKLALESIGKNATQELKTRGEFLGRHMDNLLSGEREKIRSLQRIANLYDPRSQLARGYALVSVNGKFIKSTSQVSPGNQLNIKLSDGTIEAAVNKVLKNG
jgi:exodeoxyribonuclease VII large subunit